MYRSEFLRNILMELILFFRALNSHSVILMSIDIIEYLNILTIHDGIINNIMHITNSLPIISDYCFVFFFFFLWSPNFNRTQYNRISPGVKKYQFYLSTCILWRIICILYYNILCFETKRMF